MADGNLIFDTKIDESGFEKGAKSIENTGNNLLSSFKKLEKAVAVAFSTQKVIDFGKASVEAAAAVNAANSQFSQTFGEMKAQAESAMQSVAESSGIIQTRLQGVGTSIYAFAKTSGMDSASALTMMEEALQVTADSAAYYDRSLEETSESLKSFLKGNYANDAALGLSATETTRNAAANKLYGKSFNELSEAQKQLTLLQMVKDANVLSGAEGQAAREADGLENVIGNLKETWKQFIAVIGQPILKATVNVVKMLTIALQETASAVGAVFEAFSEVIGVELTASDSAEDLSKSAESSAESYGDMARSAEEANEASENSLASFDKVTKLGDSNASGGTSADTSGATGTVTPTINTKPVEEESSKLAEFLKGVLLDIKDYLNKNFKDIFSDIFVSLASEFVKLGGTFQGIWADMQTLMQPLKDYFSKDLTPFLQTTVETIGLILVGLFDTFNMVFSDIWNLAVFPIIQSFLTLGLPLITQLATEIVLTLSTLFSSVKEIFDQLWIDVVQPVLGFISQAWEDLMTSLSDFWNTWGQPIFDSIRDAITGTKDTFLTVWNTLLKPCFDNIMKTVDKIWTGHIKPLADKILDFVGEVITAALDIYNKAILPIVNWLVVRLAPAFNLVFGAISKVVGTVVGNIIGYIGGIIDVLKDIVHFIKCVFKGDWKNAWQAVKDAFSSIWETLVNVAKKPINLIIGAINKMTDAIESAINWIIDGINELSFDVPDWVPGIGGETFGFDIDNISIPDIPYLAKGAVIPPNSEFLAVLGDQKRGTNIEAPLATIEQALANVLSKFSGNGNEKISLTLPIYLNTRRGLRLLSTEIIDDINSIIARTGEVPINI